MIKTNAKCSLLIAMIVAGCAQESSEPQFRSFDLNLTHPSPYSTYIEVSPGDRAADLPRLRALDSRGFSEYLRESVGCVYDDSRDIFPLGSKRIPAGYIVPIRCTSAE